MVVDRRMPHGRLLGLLTALLAACALAPLASATSDGAHETQYFFVDSEDPLGPAAGQWEDLGAQGLALGDDEISDPIDLTFSFMFFGQAYRSIRVSANGFITFGIGSGSFDNQPIPTVGLPEAAIFVFWDDLIIPDPGLGVQANLVGVAPTANQRVGNRRMIIQWDNVTFFDDPAGQFNSISFQCVLFEGSNDIEFRYRAPRGPLGRGDSATIGLEDETGRFGNQYRFNRDPVENEVYDGLVIRWTSYTQSVANNFFPVQNAQYTAIENDKRRRHGEGSHICFVTNASYGSPIAPEVKVLSSFRDAYLMPTAAGRGFVDFYYRSSPGLSTMISRYEGVKLPIRMALRPPIWFASFMLFSTAAEKAAVAVLVLVLGMVLGRAMCRRLVEPER